MGLAQEFASWVQADDRFEIVAPHPLTLVCFRHRDGDDTTRQLLERLNDSGRMFLTHTILSDAYTIRFSIGATLTERKHVEQAWRWIREATDELAGAV